MSRTLLDTNVLVGSISDTRQAPVQEAIRSELLRDSELCVAPQSIYEFWSVATRPPNTNGLGLDAEEAYRMVARIRTTFTVLPDPPELLEIWLQTCRAANVLGRPSHDARLVAWMRGHGINRILTFERNRFARYDIEAVEL